MVSRADGVCVWSVCFGTTAQSVVIIHPKALYFFTDLLIQGFSLVSAFIGNTMNTFVPNPKPQVTSNINTFGVSAMVGENGDACDVVPALIGVMIMNTGDSTEDSVTMQAQQQVGAALVLRVIAMW